ncbi:MAG: cupin domain-containing protein, partial [Clostridia bacterium]|nr:cupin domain-containing protein [Clostridia bacterium]
MDKNSVKSQLSEIAFRIKEMREICGLSIDEMAIKTDTTPEQYKTFETGTIDFPFSFIHKCSLAFGIGMNDLLEGKSANLSSYVVTRKNEGLTTAKEDGINISNLAPLFRNKLAEPYWVHYEYSEDLQNKPIHKTTHSGQEFDLVLSGTLKVQVGNNVEILNEGDSIYYDSSTPHGMIAVDGKDCYFCAVVISGDAKTNEQEINRTIVDARQTDDLLIKKFINTTEDENGTLTAISFNNEDKFNFAYDVVDAIADKDPDKTALVFVDDGATVTAPA